MAEGEVQPVNPEPSQPMAAPPQGGGSGWVAWVVGIVLVILVGGGLFYYYQYIKIPALQSQIDNLKSQLNNLQEQANEGLVDNSLIYKNEKYGFQVTFTEDWTGFEVEEDSSNTGDADIYLRVYVPKEGTQVATEKPGFVNPLVLSVFTPSNWDKEQAKDGPKATLLGRSQDYVIGYAMWQDCPDADTEFCAPFTSDNLEEIKKSFEKI